MYLPKEQQYFQTIDNKANNDRCDHKNKHNHELYRKLNGVGMDFLHRKQSGAGGVFLAHVENNNFLSLLDQYNSIQ